MKLRTLLILGLILSVFVIRIDAHEDEEEHEHEEDSSEDSGSSEDSSKEDKGGEVSEEEDLGSEVKLLPNEDETGDEMGEEIEPDVALEENKEEETPEAGVEKTEEDKEDEPAEEEPEEEGAPVEIEKTEEEVAPENEDEKPTDEEPAENTDDSEILDREKGEEVELLTPIVDSETINETNPDDGQLEVSENQDQPVDETVEGDLEIENHKVMPMEKRGEEDKSNNSTEIADEIGETSGEQSEEEENDEEDSDEKNKEDSVIVVDDIVKDEDSENAPEIAEDEKFPKEMIPEQPKDIMIKKDTDGLREYEIAEAAPEVDVDPKMLVPENTGGLKVDNVKTSEDGVAFDVNFDEKDDTDKESESDSEVESGDNKMETAEAEIEKKSDDSESKNTEDENELKIYDNLDSHLIEDKLILSVIEPEIVETKPEDTEENKAAEEDIKSILNEEPVQRDEAYPSELEDDFNVDHKTGLSLGKSDVTTSEEEYDDDKNSEESDGSYDPDYEVLEKIRDEVDQATKLKDANTYVMTDELIDPIQGHHEFVIQKPSYRVFVPEENHLIQSIQDTLDNRVKRDLEEVNPDENLHELKFDNFEISPIKMDIPVHESSNDVPEFKFEDFKPEPPEGDIQELQNPESFHQVLKELIDPTIERISDIMDDPMDDPNASESQKDSNDDYQPVLVPGTSTKGKSLSEILGIPEDKGPIMIEPEYNGLYRGEYPTYESFGYGPSFFPYEFFGPVVVPDKVVVETKQKMTVIYDSDVESISEDESEEKKSGDIIIEDSDVKFEGPKFGPIIESSKTAGETTKDEIKVEKLPQLSEESVDPAPEIIQKDEPLEEAEKAADELEKAAQIFSKNLVLTVSISPIMLLLIAGFVIILFIFKIYFMRTNVKHILPVTTTSTKKIDDQSSSQPLSMITVEKTPLP